MFRPQGLYQLYKQFVQLTKALWPNILRLPLYISAISKLKSQHQVHHHLSNYRHAYIWESKGRGLRSIIYFIVKKALRCESNKGSRVGKWQLLSFNESEPEAKEARKETGMMTLYKTDTFSNDQALQQGLMLYPSCTWHASVHCPDQGSFLH